MPEPAHIQRHTRARRKGRCTRLIKEQLFFGHAEESLKLRAASPLNVRWMLSVKRILHKKAMYAGVNSRGCTRS
jgi:hypothetical protein